jgi:hypothetical protein
VPTDPQVTALEAVLPPSGVRIVPAGAADEGKLRDLDRAIRKEVEAGLGWQSMPAEVGPLGSEEMAVNNDTDAIGHLTEACKLAKRSDNRLLAAWSATLLATIDVKQGKLDEAQSLLNEALDLSLPAQSTRSLILCLTGFRRAGPRTGRRRAGRTPGRRRGRPDPANRPTLVAAVTKARSRTRDGAAPSARTESLRSGDQRRGPPQSARSVQRHPDRNGTPPSD